MSERTLLLVDDEENILRALVRLLRRDGYTIIKATSGSEGLELMAQHPVGVILSDQRMPQMSGSEFLHKVKERWPNTIRLMLSGYTDLTSVTDAINEGAVYKFLTKPWEDDLLRRNVREAFEQYELRSENERLTRELQQANGRLAELLAEKKRELGINQQILELSREVIQRMPVGVLGIGDDGVIAIANDEVHRILGRDQGSLIGCDCENSVPEITALLGEPLPEERPLRRRLGIGGRPMELHLSSIGHSSNAQGRVAVLIPVEQSHA